MPTELISSVDLTITDPRPPDCKCLHQSRDTRRDSWARRIIVRHSNAGVSDLDKDPYKLQGRTPALEDILRLGGIDPEWL